MLRITARLATIGFYVLIHPWLQSNGLVKVGYSTYIEQRLETASYKTCFTPEWYFYRVFECESELDALILEQAVLYLLRSHRVYRRELLRATGETVARAAEEVAKKLNISAVIHSNFESSFSFSKKKVKTDEMQGEENSLSLDTQVEGTDSDECGFSPLSATEKTTLKREKRKQCSLEVHDSTHDTDDPLAQVITPFLSILNSMSSEAEKNFEEKGAHVTEDSFSSSTLATHEDMDLCDSLEVPCFFDDCLVEENYHLADLRPYQQEAVQRLRTELRRNGKAICQMACRCGKTPVAYQLIREYFGLNNKQSICSSNETEEKKKNIIIYLVPGLSLLRQTAQKLFQYGLGNENVTFFLVGSHPEPVFCSFSTSLTMTTDMRQIEEITSKKENILVISTYHSSSLLKNVHNQSSLVVFDECHRVCGSCDATLFNALLQTPRCGARLFMTATPTYDTPLKMSNEEYFGGIAFRYYLREGIDSGYVNPFGVRVILGHSLDDMNPYLWEAMKLVDKLLVFCRDINHAEKLYTSANKMVKNLQSSDGLSPFECFVAHSRMGCNAVSRALQHFMSSKRGILFNVRLFQEGVEIPDLNAVFFACPRYSSRDIIQSICRPLSKLDGKTMSYVFLPAVLNTQSQDMSPVNLENFSTLIPFTDALMDEDPSLFEYMIDPENKTYNFSVVGIRSLPLTSDRIHQFILPAIRRGVRFSSRNSDRLRRVNRFPWKTVFTELQRVVEKCNRYPKNNDAWVVGQTSFSLNSFYQFCRKGYHLYERKQPTFLKVHQLRDLESLSLWKQYGVNGPYPWSECMKTLKILLSHYGTCPPLDVHKGGYIGLDASPLERLCGFLMHVNQCDAKFYLRLSPAKQKAMDDICNEFGLVWRKERDENGFVIPSGQLTFITSSYNSFKYMFENIEKFPSFKAYLQENFPGYPDKHMRMERLEALQQGIPPPRYNAATFKMRSSEEEVWKSESSTPASADKLLNLDRTRRVTCRVCRAHILEEEWEKHLVSPEHFQKLAAMSKLIGKL